MQTALTRLLKEETRKGPTNCTDEEVIDVQRIPVLIHGEELFTEQSFQVHDPGKLSDLVAEVAHATEEHVDQAVRSAAAAFQTWRQSALEERTTFLEKAATYLEQRMEELAVLLVREQGMLLNDTRMDLGRAIRIFRNTAEMAPSILEVEHYEDEESWVSIYKKPIGVVAAIIPWNAPINLTAAKLAPALAAGNTIVIKPSPEAPVTLSSVLKELAALLPPGVINVVQGGGKVGTALTCHPLVRKVAFTGSVKTGSLVMQSAARYIARVSLELGGNDPAIILEDAQPEQVIPKLLPNAFRRSGQVCFAIKRVYVPEKLYETYFDLICHYVEQYKIGYGLNSETTLGPVNNKMQYDAVNGLIERVKQSSAVVRQLGTKLEPENWNNGYYIQPVVVKDLEPQAELISCEQFGPILPLISYRTEEEVIQMANDTEYGLGASIWSNDVEKATTLIQQIESGLGFINNHTQSLLGLRYMPFGGVKQSGLGRENAAAGFMEYVEYQAINGFK